MCNHLQWTAHVYLRRECNIVCGIVFFLCRGVILSVLSNREHRKKNCQDASSYANGSILHSLSVVSAGISVILLRLVHLMMTMTMAVIEVCASATLVYVNVNVNVHVPVAFSDCF